jgi:DNA-binding NtrC family response regulator
MMQALDRRPFKNIKRELVDEFERRYLGHLLQRHRFNLAAVERSSGLSRKHIYALIQKHGLHKRVLSPGIASLVQMLP